MAMTNDGIVTRIAAAALEAYRAVELASDGTVNYPDAVSDKVYGITQGKCAIGEPVAIKLLTAPGTHKLTVASSHTMAAGGRELYLTATGGKFDDADPGSGVKWMIATEAASGDGSIVEGYPMKLG